ncbi:MAG: cyanophycin synthetase [Vitreoscilla sp.]
MKIIERRVLRGPSIHSYNPCFLAVLDLEELDEVSSAQIPGFTDRLLALLPTLQEHRCSLGYVGGFVERLREGTYMAHIAEHVTIELQCLAGHDVAFGKARMVRGQPRHYRVVVAYRSERVVEAAFEAAVELVVALAQGRDYPIEQTLVGLRAMVEHSAIGPSTRAIIEAAEQRGIPTLRLSEDANLFQLGWGSLQQRVQATTTSRSNYIAVGIASDKELTKQLLQEAGLPVPSGRTTTSLDEAIAAMHRIGSPVVVKPLDGNQGKGVTTAVTSEAGLAAAWERARGFGRQVLVEKHVAGDDYRALVVGTHLVAAARRVPPQVVGDGERSIRQLVDLVNQDPRRGQGHENVLTRIRLDDAAIEELAHQALEVDSVPEPGRVVRLRGNANLSTGGTAEDVTAAMHPDTACACVRAARKIGLDVAGIDLVCTDISQPLSGQGGAIIEVNAAPGIRMHEHPSEGERHHVGRAIVESLFPHGDAGRIPVIAVTGTNGKTTTTLAIGHVLQRSGTATGITTTEGIYIDGRQVAEGDCTGYWSARTVLTSPETEFAVLETARGGLLKRGLAFDRCDVGVVLNIKADHLGQDGIDTLEDLAEVKGLLAEVASRAVVLNAQDPICVGLVPRMRQGAETIYFSLDPDEPVLLRHLQNGGRGIYERQGMLIWADGHHHAPLTSVDRLPFTLAGHARHNIANAMAAFAALLALDIPAERIVSGLASFTSNDHQNPLRLNVFRSQGVTLLVDYAHNAAAYSAVIDTARHLTRGTVRGVVAAPGDRRKDDLAEIGRICGGGFDDLVIYEMDDLRGKAPGQTAGILLEGALQARSGRSGPPVRTVLDVRDAIRSALDASAPGDIVVVGCASQLQDLRAALGAQSGAASIHAETLSAVDPRSLQVGAETLRPTADA